MVPDGTGSTITSLSCPAPGYCAAGGQVINPPSPTSFPASAIVIDEVAGRWGKTVSLNDGYIGTPDTESIYAVSCAAPRSCGAGGNLGGGMGGRTQSSPTRGRSRKRSDVRVKEPPRHGGPDLYSSPSVLASVSDAACRAVSLIPAP